MTDPEETDWPRDSEDTDWPRVLTPPYTPLLLTPLTDSSQSSNGSVDVPLTPMNCTRATRPEQPELALAADDDSDPKLAAAAKLRDGTEQKLSTDAANNNDAGQWVHKEQSGQEEKFSVETNQSEQEIPTKMIVGGVLVAGVVVVVGTVTAGAGFAATAAIVCVL